jgi:Domain of unknown function (DUF6438)
MILVVLGTLLFADMSVSDAEAASPRQGSPSQATTRKSSRPAARTILRFERTPCYGSCPAYAVEVDADGAIRYHGKAHVLVKGQRSARATAKDLERLREILSILQNLSGPQAKECADFITDHPGVDLSVADGTGTKTISDYHGCRAMKDPDQDAKLKQLRELEDQLDSILATDRWVGRSEQRRR